MIDNNETNNEEENDDGIYFYPEDANSEEIDSDKIDDTVQDVGNLSTRDTVYGAQRFSDHDSNEDHGHGKDDENEHNSGGATIMSEILSYIKIILCAVAIAFIFTQFIIVNAQVPTGSMTDTINIGDRLIGFRLSYLFSDPQRGDIVIFKYPDDETQNYVKRVIGTPGDVIQIKDGQVIVNGEVLEEDYLLEDMIPRSEEEVYVVPDNCYFMMGDNRNNSLDSRYWENTYVSKDKILAKVIFRYYNGNTKRIDFSTVK